MKKPNVKFIRRVTLTTHPRKQVADQASDAAVSPQLLADESDCTEELQLLPAEHPDDEVDEPAIIDLVPAHSLVSATESTDVSELDALKNCILSRTAIVHVFWFENGRDLTRAKLLVGHGQFEKWCKDNLSYGKSMVEKQMHAYRVLSPLLESVNIPDFPRAALAFKLAANNVPEKIRADFVDRIAKGEKGIAHKLAKELIAEAKLQQGDVDAADIQSSDGGPDQAEDEPCSTSGTSVTSETESEQAAAVGLIVDGLGDKLQVLLEMVEGGTADLFTTGALIAFNQHPAVQAIMNAAARQPDIAA